MSKFNIVEKDNPTSDAEISKILDNPGFGDYLTDHMAHISYRANDDLDKHLMTTSKNGTWFNHEVVPFGNISISPAASVFHYGQEIFEGVKAYRRSDDSIWMFRPELNAERFQKSALRLGLPDLSIDDFVESIKEVVRIDRRWVSSREHQALYIRPFMIATEAFIGVGCSKEVDYYCILSPVGNYFGKPKPVNIWVEEEFFRAGPGGTGFAKCGGNYAASLLPAAIAYEKGFSQVLYLDAADRASVEELGGMSFFAVKKDGSVLTPRLNGQILDSVTRRSVIEVLKDRGTKIEETKILLNDLINGIKSGEIVECFACGTAAVIASIGRLAGKGFDVQIGVEQVEGELTVSLRDEIVGIQTGKVEDRFGWCTKIC
ncbi:MAG: branched-chain amino acid aminotransferase [Candidatus Ancillula sp.]|nr:branched-chain amino acid aminotransferase [Candidatus Ancillula sp.]